MATIRGNGRGNNYSGTNDADEIFGGGGAPALRGELFTKQPGKGKLRILDKAGKAVLEKEFDSDPIEILVSVHDLLDWPICNSNPVNFNDWSSTKLFIVESR